MSSIRVILELTASLDLEFEQLDVKTVFLHRNLVEKIYMVNQKDLRRLERSTWFAD